MNIRNHPKGENTAILMITGIYFCLIYNLEIQ